ncbi:DNA repair protein RecO [Candidatus Sumerlaeota bacterium]
MAAIKTEAVVLSASDYSESSRLVSLLTPGQGKVRLIAKGIRGTKSRQRGSAEAMSHIEARFSLKTPGGLGNLMESRVLNPAEYLRQDLAKYAIASTLVELLERSALAPDSGQGLFELLRDFLRELRDARDGLGLLARALATALSELGFRPETRLCVSCGQAEQARSFSVPHGGIVCGNCAAQVQPTVGINAGLQRALDVLVNEPEETAKRLRFTGGQLPRLVDLLLDLAQHHLEIRLNSRVFLSTTLAGRS